MGSLYCIFCVFCISCHSSLYCMSKYNHIGTVIMSCLDDLDIPILDGAKEARSFGGGVLPRCVCTLGSQPVADEA